jgi:hypothetical protein
MTSLILGKVLPELTKELEGLLTSNGELGLAVQVQSLALVDRCRCDSDSCATFYCVPKPKGAWGSNHRNVLLDTKEGLTVVDVLDEKIVCIELLDRADIRSKVLKLLP